MAKKILWILNLWLPPLLWAGMIFRFSSGSIPAASDVYWQDFIVKKVGHMILFAILAILFYRALVGEGVDRKKAAISAVLIALIYGAVDEFHQTFVPTRSGAIRDIGIDSIGIFISFLYTKIHLSKLVKKRLI